MARRDHLSELACQFLCKSGFPAEVTVAEVAARAAQFLLPLSRPQIEALAALCDIHYDSRAASRDQGYRVHFFPSSFGIDAVLNKNVFVANDNQCWISGFDTDPTHELDGLVMAPSGALTGGFDDSVIYESAYQVVERDAILDFLELTYIGGVSLKPRVTINDVASRLTDVIAYAPACDRRNALFLGERIALLYQGWYDVYAIRELGSVYGPFIGIFGTTDDQCDAIRTRLQDITQQS